MNKPKQPNPWTKNKPPTKKSNSVANVQKAPTPSEQKNAENKFKEAHKKLQEAVQKHVKDYESSSDEEELELTNVLEGVLKNYTKSGGTNEQLERTQVFLHQSFQSGAATCLICISRVKRDDEVWSCSNCYDLFHLMCIQRWSKDTTTHQKQVQEGEILVTKKTISWGCPKCRFDYKPEHIPTKYWCYCKKTEKPKFEPYLVPHSCGEICRKDLSGKCGHKCLLLCHPGPCPPCPVTVSVKCYCGAEQPQTRRCSQKEWSCSQKCNKLLSCKKHSCSDSCHSGDCSPCPKKSIQRCTCGAQQKLRDCATPLWQCEKVCNKPLECGNHKCPEVCHTGVCDVCSLTKQRSCPCGKTKYQLPCTEETPTCPDTCDKLLECGEHTCNLKCHKDKCGLCLETVVKQCQCGLHTKEVQCHKPYLCESKCKKMKDCNKHPCNRKCCDGNCPPCTKPCGKTLSCGNHKCSSVCHRGPCYPCSNTEIVACHCGFTKLTVPCGRKHKTKPPRCSKLCKIAPDCHHEKRVEHRCHFGECPNCKQVCNKSLKNCQHLCPESCHSAVLIKVEGQKASMPWEQQKPQQVRKALPCPDCMVPMPVTCLGEHETAMWPCHLAKPSNCGRPCGRLLSCQNHTCALPCHLVENAVGKESAGTNCETCHGGCSKPRLEGCTHECPKPCHPAACPPCKQMIRVKCHCGLNQIYVQCHEWLNEDKKEQLQNCGNQCPKNYECGHRCKTDCHSGPCPNAELCKKKMKLTCKCKRLKKEISCEAVRKGAKVECDEVCAVKKEEERKLREAQNEEKRKEEELRNQKELEKYQKMFEGKKKNRERRYEEVEQETSVLTKYWYIFAAVGICSLALGYVMLS